MRKQKIGVAGVGKISEVYLPNITKMFGDQLILSAVTDVDSDRARQIASQYKVAYCANIDELVNSTGVDIVLNLTPPHSHYEVARTAIRAGKHIYNEKPFCIRRKDAAEILKTAAKANVRAGGAPDTFLGTGLQTCRKLIDDGVIGTPVAAVAFVMGRGPEHWHPDPAFFYQKGGGPLFDMGPYYLSALVHLLGPVARISGSAQTGIKQRTITSEPLNGTVINVAIPTHIAGVLDFASGAVCTIITSFEVYSHTLPCLEIYGSDGTMRVPDPNFFNGPVLVKRYEEEGWTEMPLVGSFSGNSRGLGLADMAVAISKDRPHRACGELAYHVLDIMHGMHDASERGKYYNVKSTCTRPAPFLDATF